MTGKHGMLQSMGLQRVKHDSATEQQQSDLKPKTQFQPVNSEDDVACLPNSQGSC